MELKIAWLYPDLMSTYGDRGNIVCLQKRCAWRGIKAEIGEITLESAPYDVQTCDLLFMGGAQDRQQKLASQDLYKNKGPILKEMIEKGIPGLFICGAYQFLGHYYHSANGEDIPGLEIFDLYTKHFGEDKPRCIGNVIAEISNFNPPAGGQISNLIVGFENHGGRTYLGKNIKPLAKVVKGYGNNGEDGTEGAIYKNAFGSYLHGPFLPKNPHFADHLLKLALCKKYQKEIKLEPIDDGLEWQAHKTIIKRIIEKE